MEPNRYFSEQRLGLTLAYLLLKNTFNKQVYQVLIKENVLSGAQSFSIRFTRL
ncbi:hypothetical protein FHS24_001515 [Psychrobacter luti]|uniref:Uncharacterized protein n=1 Tax=Psychrobacter luti TaxID=198481 RepID=A0A839TCW4_9GAMM|nr:hypothetical protein [Psychrobacter luti]